MCEQGNTRRERKREYSTGKERGSNTEFREIDNRQN
jgi:hypothetical protein